jgi:hypothetical protein
LSVIHSPRPYGIAAPRPVRAGLSACSEGRRADVRRHADRMEPLTNLVTTTSEGTAPYTSVP